MADEATLRQAELRAELVRVRKQAGVTQAALALALHCTQGKITKIERGRVGIKLRDLHIWLKVCNVPAEQADGIKSLALVADPTAPSGLSYNPAMNELLVLERRTSETLTLQSEGLPRQLQADRYLFKQFEGAGVLKDPKLLLDEKEDRVEVLRASPSSPYRCLLSESSLRRMPGGDQGLVIDQAKYVLRLMEDCEHVSVQILTFDAAIPWLDSNFIILKFDGQTQDVMYAEFACEARIHRKAELVAEREKYWHQLQLAALSREDSMAYLGKLIDQVEATWRPGPVT